MTVGEFKKMFKYCEDDEPLSMYLYSKTPLFGELQEPLKCTGAQSTAGGRATILWFELEKSGNKNEPS